MKRFTLLVILLAVTSFGLYIAQRALKPSEGAPPYAIEDLIPPAEDQYAWLKDWKRPEGPARIGLQVGHWKNNELPEELSRLEGSTGATGGGKTEWEVNLAIAEETKKILLTHGVTVDILPATIPPRYWADAFVAIHADGNTDTTVSGFKAATPRRDYGGNAQKLLTSVEDAYEKTTGLVKDPNVSRNMRGYYAFAWWRYDHAVHPMASSIILETGFLSNPSDRRVIVNNPSKAAQGLADGIISYLETMELL